MLDQLIYHINAKNLYTCKSTNTMKALKKTSCGSDIILLKLYYKISGILGIFPPKINSTYWSCWYTCFTFITYLTKTLLAIHQLLSESQFKGVTYCIMYVLTWLILQLFNFVAIHDIVKQRKGHQIILERLTQMDYEFSNALKLENMDKRNQLLGLLSLSIIVIISSGLLEIGRVSSLLDKITAFCWVVSIYQIFCIAAISWHINNCFKRRYDALHTFTEKLCVRRTIVFHEDIRKNIIMCKQIFRRLNEVVETFNNCFGKYLLWVFLGCFIYFLSVFCILISNYDDISIKMFSSIHVLISMVSLIL